MPNLTSLSAKHSSSSWIAVMLVIFLSTSVGATDYLMLGTYSYSECYKLELSTKLPTRGHKISTHTNSLFNGNSTSK